MGQRSYNRSEDRKELVNYINQYKQVSLLKEIENRFGTAKYL